MSERRQRLIAQRDEKRRRIQSLFEEQQRIQAEMQSLEHELMTMDDAIDALLEEEETSSSPVCSDEVLTDPAAAAAAATQFAEDGLSQLSSPPSPSSVVATENRKKRTLDEYFASPPQSNSNKKAAVAKNPHAIVNDGTASAPAQAASFPWTQKMMELLRDAFGIKSFRDHQEDIINTTMQGRDAFVLMRTGGGKSLTYQLPALLEGRYPRPGRPPKVTIVISPLISLIRDQENQMNDICPGSALSFTSNLPGGTSEHARRWRLVQDPDAGVCIVLVTPEKVHKSGRLKEHLQKLDRADRLGRIVIDECHCASQWGHDFRPDYAKLGVLKAHFPNAPLLAVTATASEEIREDLYKILRMSPTRRFFRSSANRPNLNYSVRVKADGKDAVLDDMAAFIKERHPNGPGIVYAYSRKDADTVANKLCDRGIVAHSYHSDVSPANKDLIQSSWMKNDTQVVVATIAFGLGINKPDVRFVLHHTLSKTLEAYYQESGRAGRDGEPADCVCYYSPRDVPRMIKLVHASTDDSLFWSMVRYAQAFGNDHVCRAVLLNYLGEPDAPDVAEAIANNDAAEPAEVGHHAKTVVRLLDLRIREGKKLTQAMLVKEWRATKNVPQFLKDNPPGKHLSASDCERIIVALLIDGVLGVDVVWNAYDSVVYISLGKLGAKLLQSPDPKMTYRFPKKTTLKKTVPAEDGWIRPNAAAKQRARARARAKKKVVVQLDDSDSDSEVQVVSTRKATLRRPAAAKKNQYDDDDSELEFE